MRGFGWEECWEGYRRQAFLGVLMTVAPAMLVQRTERGDEMFLVTLARYAQQVLDLDAVELLPEPGSGRPPALRPEPRGRGSPRARLGGAVERELVLRRRLRRRAPRRLHAAGPVPEPRRLVDDRVRVRPGPRDARADRLRRPAARRAEQLSLGTEQLRAEHICIEPLESFEVRLQGSGGELRRTRRRSCAASAASRSSSRSRCAGTRPGSRTPTGPRRAMRSPAG